MKKCEEGLAGIKRRGLVLIVSRAATPYPEKERPRRNVSDLPYFSGSRRSQFRDENKANTLKYLYEAAAK